MVGLLIIAHQPLASALVACAAHVYACDRERARSGLRTLDVPADADVEQMVAAARVLLAEIDDGSGVLVLTDAFGATPGNIATRLTEPQRVAVVAGANLPMLLRALCYRDRNLAETVEKVIAGGIAGIMQVAISPVQNQSQRVTGDDQARFHHQQ